ncbi:AmmeMemoRadiSam system protein B [Thermodesulfobacteriota bacterium]
MLRSPAVAGQFYPGSESSLIKALDSLIPHIQPEEKKDALAVVSPHAGYIYSGGVAGETIGSVNVPDSVIILGPNHTGHGASIALMDHGAWDMPMGEVQIDKELASAIKNSTEQVQVDEMAHRLEHSLEVQVPFLQYMQKNLQIAPIVVSHVSYGTCVSVGNGLAEAIRNFGKQVLIVASTDMTHYESRQSASSKDGLALDRIKELDPEGLYNTVVGNRISMCGIMPTTVALIAAMALGATKADLIRYTDSGDASGDTDRVVGYAGLVIS